MRNSSLIPFAPLLLPIVAGFAASPEPLVQRVDADSQAAAALMSAHEHPDRSVRLIAHAASMAPDRADLAWLHIQFCQRDASCDPEPLERRLRSLDGKNGAGWLGALARAGERGDEEAKSAALAAMGRAERVDIYWTTLIARLSRPVADARSVSLFDAEVFVIGALAAVAIPAYQTVAGACDSERLVRDDVAAVCRGVADAFLQGDTAITEMTGVAIATRAWPEHSPKWVEATKARRVRDYRVQFADPAAAWHRAHAGDYLALCEQHRREQDVEQAVLVAIGRNPDPPPVRSEATQAGR
ncbi:MAG: hypothetical protein AB7G76_03335 [Steroidobacteraceae bacterium]